jgi:nicotinamidase-related amidase
MRLVDRADSTLVVIDAQTGFVAHHSMTERERERAGQALERAAWLVAIAGQLDIPVVVVEEGPHRARSTHPRVLDQLPEGAPVVVKTTFNLAACPDAMRALDGIGRRTTVLVGFETDTCVAESAVGLREHGYRVVVAQDASYSTGDVEHQRGLARMSSAGIELHDCEGLTFEWLPVVDEAIDTVRKAKEVFGPPPLRL